MAPCTRKRSRTPKVEPLKGKLKTPNMEPSERKQKTPKMEPSKGKQITQKMKPSKNKPITPKMEHSEGKQITQKMKPSKGKQITQKMKPSKNKPITPKMEPSEGKQKTPKAEPSKGKQITPKAEPSEGKPLTPKMVPYEGKQKTPVAEPFQGKQITPKTEPSQGKPLRVKMEPGKQETMEIKKSLENQTDVSMTLTKHLLQESKDSNVVFSPLSLQLVLGLVAAGAESQSLEELLSFLKAESTDELNSIASHLFKYLFVDDSPSDATLRLSFANGVWIDKSLSFKPFFRKVADDVYKAASDVVDFQNEASEAAKKVNSWVENKTNGLVKDVISPGSLDRETKIIFTNAIYFKGLWANKFDMMQTGDYEFHLLNDSSVSVPFMTSTMEYHYISSFDGFKVLEIPYKQEKDMPQISMYFFLPDAKDGLSTLVDKLASESGFIERHIPSDIERVGKLQIPKFKISFGFEASNTLKELGLRAPFIIGRRDFDGMVNSQYIEQLYVSSIFQKSYIEVNEYGTEACAYSRVHQCGGGSPVTKIDFVADHPFLFFIRENKTGVVLFIGQVLNPKDTWPDVGILLHNFFSNYRGY